MEPDEGGRGRRAHDRPTASAVDHRADGATAAQEAGVPNDLYGQALASLSNAIVDLVMPINAELYKLRQVDSPRWENNCCDCSDDGVGAHQIAR